MTYEIAERARRRTRRVLFLAAIVGVLLVSLLVFGLVGGISGRSPAQASPGPTSPGNVAPSGAPAPPSSSSPSDQPAADVVFTSALGDQLPVSKTAGPRALRTEVALGFTRTRLGAALAAVHLFVRLTPDVGPGVYRPAIVFQVVGDGKEPMQKLISQQYDERSEAAGITDGGPLRDTGSNAVYIGYNIETFTQRTARVHLLAVSADGDPSSGQDVVLDLRWAEDLPWGPDWVLVAPADGTWSATFGPQLGAQSYVSFTSPGGGS